MPKKSSNKILKAAKIFGITTGSLAILLFVIPCFFKDTITKRVNEIAKDYIKSDVKFEKINLSFYSHFPNLTVSLENSVIGASDNFPNQNLINAQNIGLGIDLFSLFGDKITFNKLYLSNADINVKVDSLGNSNYDIFISDEQSPKDDSSVNLHFDKIKVKNTNILYNDEKSKVTFKATNLVYNGLVSFINNVVALQAKASIEQVFFVFDKTTYIDKKTLKADLNTQIDLNNLSFTFNKNQFVLEKFPFEVDGKVSLPENTIDFDLKISSENKQLVDLFSIVPQSFQKWYDNTQIEGISSFKFSLLGKMNDSLQLKPNANIALQITNGLINYNKGQFPINNLNLKTNIDIPNLNPDSLNISVSDFNFNLNDGFAKGNLNFKAPTTVQANLNAKLNLEMLKQASGIDFIDMKGMLEMQSKIDGTYATATKKVGIRNKVQTYVASIPRIQIASKITNGYFKMKDLPMGIEDIFADFEINNTDGILENTAVLINEIKAKASDNYINGFAKIENLKNYKMETNIKARLNLADITSIFPVESLVMRGNLVVNFNAKGVYEPTKNVFPVTKTHFKLENGYIKYTDIPELPIENIQVEMNVMSTKGSMNDLKVEVLPISFKLAGEPFKLDANLYNFNNLTYKINSNGTLDLSKIYKIFAIDGYNVNGWIKANLNINGKGTTSDNSSVNNRGFLDLRDIYLDSDLFPQSFIIKNGKLKFQREKIILDNVSAKYASNQFKITGDVSNYMNFALTNNAILNGNINVETNKFNVDEFMVFNTNTTSSKTTTSNANSGVVMVPSNFDFSLNANAKKVLFNGIELSNFKGNLSVNKGRLNLSETQFNLIDALFHMKGTYQPVSTKLATFDYSIKANDFSIQKAYNEITLFRELASAAKSVYGSVSLDYNLSGVLGSDMMPKLKTITGNGVLTLNDIQFKGFKLFNAVSEKTSFGALNDAKASKVDIRTSIANNVMTIEPTKFKIAGFRPRIQGKVTLDGRMNLGFRLGLPPFGIIGIPMTITGNSDDFKIKIGKQKEEDLEETDPDYQDYKKSLEPVDETAITK